MLALSTLIPWLAQGSALGISAAATPGPLQALFLSNALRADWRRTIPLAFTPIIADIPLVPLILLVLNQLPDTFLNIIRILGSGLLFYLAWGIWKSGTANEESDAGEEQDNSKGLPWAVLMAWLSPGPYLFWSLVNGPLLLSAWEQSAISAITFLSSFYGLFVGGNLALIFLFSQTQRLGPKVVPYLQILSSLILAVFGVSLLWSGVAGLV
ncbi:MAG: hypothetical protein DWQ07_02480 [Chloroflexi bacterium]|nr:MAG: hypothetical protein DWQ07_02480 [Chloroflexota bacterium]MBL1193634.1 hypothetical protein [Chloroflexota bacterium]NOH10926.1 LysE family transporter [Chloroflexota bacterium]